MIGPEPTRGPLRDIWKWALLALLVGATSEILSYAAGRILATRGLVYIPEDASGYEEYLRKRDPLLGWPAPETFGTQGLDASGARISPAFPDPAMPPCVSLFGDSFTFGDDVGPEDAYGNVLATLLGCRVANYGVGGYGTDQAYLRFRDRIREAAPVTVLGHYADNVIRNVNRFRGFLSGSRLGLKPRFLLDERGALRLLPLPELTAAEYAELWRRPDLLPHEYFFPNGPAGVTVLRFPYSLSVLRVLGHYRLAPTSDGMPSYAAFYTPEHGSAALHVTLAILEAFWREARARGSAPVVLLIPDEKDLIAMRRSGAPSYGPLEDGLRRSGIETPPVARRMLDALGGREPCALYVRCGGAHFNPEGYALLARVVFDWIREHGLLPPAAPEGIASSLKRNTR